MRTAQRFTEAGIAGVRAQTGRPIRAAHLAIFPFIHREGTRPSEVARRQRVSKQAVSPLIKDLVAWGTLERTPDPADGRAQRVRFSQTEGWALMDGMAIVMTLEAKVAATLGAERLVALREELKALEAALIRLD